MVYRIKQVRDKILLAVLFLSAVLWATPLPAIALEADSSNLFTVNADSLYSQPAFDTIVKGAGPHNIKVNFGTYVQCQEGWTKSQGDSLQVVIKSPDTGDILAQGTIQLTTQTSVYLLGGAPYEYSVIVDLTDLACGRAWWIKIHRTRK